MKKNLYILVTLFIMPLFISACNNTAQIKETEESLEAVLQPTPTSTQNVENSVDSDLEPITPENVQYLEELSTLGDGRIFSFAVSPDMKMLAIYAETGIHIYDTTNLEEITAIDLPPDVNRYKVVRFSPDGKYLVYSSWTSIIFWNVEQQKLESMFFTTQDWPVRDILFSSDGQNMAISSSGGTNYCDGTAINFAIYANNGEIKFNENYCYFIGALFVKNNEIYVEGGISPYLQIHSFDDGNLLYKIKKYDLPESGTTLTLDSGAVIEIPSKQELDDIEKKYVKHQNQIITERVCNLSADWTDVPFFPISSNGKTAIYLSIYQNNIESVELVNLVNCQTIKTLEYRSSSFISLSPDGRFLAASNGKLISVWDINNSKLQYTIKNDEVGYHFNAMVFSRDSSRFFTNTVTSVSDDYSVLQTINGKISIWDALTGEKIKDIQTQDEEITEIITTANKNILATIDSKEFILWDIDNGKKINGIPKRVGVYTINQAKNEILTIYNAYNQNYHSITIFNLVTGKSIDSYSLPAGSSISKIQTSNDGLKMFVTLQNDEFYIFDLSQHNVIYSSSISKNQTDNLTSPKRFNYGVTVWNFNNPDSIVQIPGNIYDQIFQTNELILLRNNNTLQFWNIMDNNYLGKYIPNFEFYDFQLSPDNKKLVLKDSNGLIHILGVRKSSVND